MAKRVASNLRQYPHPSIAGTVWIRRLNDDQAAAELVRLVARDRKVPLPLLLHQSRCRAKVAATRQLAMYLVHVTLGRSLTEVGLLFGRDRTTVSHACALIEDMRDRSAFDADVSRLETAFAEAANSNYATPLPLGACHAGA